MSMVRSSYSPPIFDFLRRVGKRFWQVAETPWKLETEGQRWLIYPQVRILFAINRIPWGSGWRLYGAPVIHKHRHSQIRFGAGLQLRSWSRSNPLGLNHPVVLATWSADACLEVGPDFCMSGGTLCAARRIVIGKNVAVGANSIIVDTDFHPIDCRLRQVDSSAGNSKAVLIEDNVFIGMNCLILKGVTIGCGSVVGAGSVVTNDVPPHTVVAGNPARMIREMRP